MSTRLEQLQKMLAREPNDTFLLYGIAMEHKKAGDEKTALQMLEKVITIDPGHGYAFFQRGQILEMSGDSAGAKQAYTDGIAAAIKSGDAHARSELEGALSQLQLDM
jgi:Flp pilus assembly protein TadD